MGLHKLFCHEQSNFMYIYNLYVREYLRNVFWQLNYPHAGKMMFTLCHIHNVQLWFMWWNNTDNTVVDMALLEING